MAVSLGDLDAHEQPSDTMRAEWKAFTKLDHNVVLQDPRIDDTRRPHEETGFKTAGHISKAQMKEAFSQLGLNEDVVPVEEDAPILHHPLLPGKTPFGNVGTHLT